MTASRIYGPNPHVQGILRPLRCQRDQDTVQPPQLTLSCELGDTDPVSCRTATFACSSQRRTHVNEITSISQLRSFCPEKQQCAQRTQYVSVMLPPWSKPSPPGAQMRGRLEKPTFMHISLCPTRHKFRSVPLVMICIIKIDHATIRREPQGRIRRSILSRGQRQELSVTQHENHARNELALSLTPLCNTLP